MMQFDGMPPWPRENPVPDDPDIIGLWGPDTLIVPPRRPRLEITDDLFFSPARVHPPATSADGASQSST